MDAFPTHTVDKAYVVCATPRSGSTLLCELLAATGVAGRPQEPFEHLRATGLPRQPRQYLEGVDDPATLDLLPPLDPGAPDTEEAFEARLAHALRDGTTPNGVFATKLMWGYALELFARLRRRPASRGLPPAEALAATVPVTTYVHVTRPDKLAQAISLWTAVQTARWRDEGEEAARHEPVYSRAGIAHLLGQLEAQDRAWPMWFRAAGIEPVTVRYDELVADQAATVGRVLDAIGERGEVRPVDMRRQSGERSAQWRERFEAERAAAG